MSARGSRLPSGMVSMILGLIISVLAYSKIQQIYEIVAWTGMTSQLQDDYNGSLFCLIIGIILAVLGLGLLVSASGSIERPRSRYRYDREL